MRCKRLCIRRDPVIFEKLCSDPSIHLIRLAARSTFPSEGKALFPFEYIHSPRQSQGRFPLQKRAEYDILFRMEFVEQLLNWYPGHHRDLPWRKTRDPYAIWISEIMLQQTRVAAVIPYYERFLKELPDVASLAAVSDDRLLRLWQGLGYYSRARNLKRAANEVLSRFAGRMPETYGTLLTLPGIGSYTAGAIASIAFSERVPAVDGNVLRVYARIMNDPSDVSDPAVKARVFDELKAVMPEDSGAFNQALMELGAVVCVAYTHIRVAYLHGAVEQAQTKGAVPELYAASQTHFKWIL